MSRRFATALALLIGVALVPHALPATAASRTASAGVAHAAVPKAPKAGSAWIQGSVQDRAKRFVDNVDVAAFPAGKTKGEPAASALTYAPVYQNGHGWFRLYDLAPGDYKLRFSSPKGTKDPFRTTWSKTIKVKSKQAYTLSTTTLTLVRKVSAKLTLQFADSSVKPTQQPQLKISLTSADVRPVSGDLYVKIDKQREWKTQLKAENDGHLTLKLPKQKLGQHSVTVSFGGNDAVMKTTKPVTLPFWVTRNGR